MVWGMMVFYPWNFVDLVKGTTLCSKPRLMDWGLWMLQHVYICIVTLKGI